MSAAANHPKPRRNIELLLLLVALAISCGALLLVGITMEDELDTRYWVSCGALIALALAFHVVLRFRAKYADPFILPLAVTLNGLGLTMIHRLDLGSGGIDVAPRQVVWTAVSMAAAIVFLWVLRDHRRLRQFTYISLVASIILLLMPMVPGLGTDQGMGAQVWVTIAGMSFQPGEIAKITLGVFFAGFLANNRDLILLAGKKIGPMTFPRLQDLAPVFVAWLAALGVLIYQNDLGMALMFFGLFVAMIYVATSRVSWLLIGGTFIAAGAVLAYLFVWHVRNRFEIWLNPFDEEILDRDLGSWQLVQGLFGLSNGGLTGTGLGQGSPNTVPLANSDMIPTAFGEELGFIGLAAMLMLYFILASRYMRAGIGTRDTFGKLLATGMAVILVLSVFVVFGGITRVIPMSGLVSPFLAAGGSALLANWLIVALVLLISDSGRRPIVVGPMVNTSGKGASGTEDPLRYRDTGRPSGVEQTSEHPPVVNSGPAGHRGRQGERP